jgi:hypothetical protein
MGIIGLARTIKLPTMTNEKACKMKSISFAVVMACGIAGCAKKSPNPVESSAWLSASVSSPARRPKTEALSSSSSPANDEKAEVLPDLPPSVGLDDAPGKRQRVPTAVVLYGARWGETDELRFVPLVCTVAGKIEMGKPCGLAMPVTAKVRVTRRESTSPAIMTLARTTKDFHDEAGERDYKAPTGPACCMYNTCIEETIPYLTKATQNDSSRMLAVWPETADVDLQPRGSGPKAIEFADVPWKGAKGVRIEQALRAGGQRLVAARGPCGSCGSLAVDRGSGFVPMGDLGPGVDGYDILATTDVDGDGHPEAIVYEAWRNDYGVHVLGNDWSKPAYRFSCGNI